MKINTKTITLFGLLTALSLVLGFFDKRIPLLAGIIPGFKLGLANTVLIYAVYMMDWKSCVLLMMTKVLLSSLLFGNMDMFWVSFGGGALSLLTMLVLKKKPEVGILAVAIVSAASIILLAIYRSAAILVLVLISIVFIACIVIFICIHRGIMPKIVATSMCGAVAHNLGQLLVACLKTYIPDKVWISYFPTLVIIGAVLGCMTGIVAERVIKLLKYKPLS